MTIRSERTGSRWCARDADRISGMCLTMRRRRRQDSGSASIRRRSSLRRQRNPKPSPPIESPAIVDTKTKSYEQHVEFLKQLQQLVDVWFIPPHFPFAIGLSGNLASRWEAAFFREDVFDARDED